MGKQDDTLQWARLLSQHLRRPAGRATLVYLVVASSASVLSAFVGSLSEYRFPHPLLTTTLHLSISLVALVALSLLAQALLPLLPSSRRLLSTPQTSTTANVPSTLSSRSLLTSLASLTPSRRTLLTPLTPYALSSALLAVLASLLELNASRITETPFWTVARLLPMPLTLLVAPNHSARGWTVLAWSVLMAGPAVGWSTGAEGILSGVCYAACLAAWVLAAKRGLEASKRRAEDPTSSSAPNVLLHLVLCTLLLLPPLFLSHEIDAAASSGHFGFFTEAGFWAQEIVMALSGLASLGAFWSLVKHLEPPAVFLVVGLKDFLLPYLFSIIFGNPLPSKRISGSALSQVKQMLALMVLGVYRVLDRWPQLMGTSEQGEGRTKAG